jgi:hypothetical protein
MLLLNILGFGGGSSAKSKKSLKSKSKPSKTSKTKATKKTTSKAPAKSKKQTINKQTTTTHKAHIKTETKKTSPAPAEKQTAVTSTTTSRKQRKKRSTGWAKTKRIPHKRHPALFRKKSGDDIEYITFTHSKIVDFDKDNKKKPLEKHDIVKAEPLNVNIGNDEKGEKLSYVVPRVYDGKRSALGEGTTDYKLDKSDESLIDKIFETGKHYKVEYSGNSKNDKKQ